MTNFLSLPDLKKKVPGAVLVAVAATALSGCTSNDIQPDGSRQDVSAICFKDGAVLRQTPNVPGEYDDPNKLGNLDLDGDPKHDSGESVCVPTNQIFYRDEPNNGRWYRIGTSVEDSAMRREVMLPDGHIAPVIFAKKLGEFASALGGDKVAWVNEARITIVNVNGKVEG